MALIAIAFWVPARAAASQQKPPTREAIVAYETRLRAENAFFARATWQIDTDSMPCVFFTQEPMSGQAAIHEGAKELYLPWLSAIASKAIETYAVPLGLSRAPDPGFSPVFVVQDQRTFTSVVRGARQTGHPDEALALALEPLSLVVTYMRQHAGSVTNAWQRMPALRAYFKEVLRQHTASGRLPREDWLLNGLASWHAYHESDQVKDLGSGAIPFEAVNWLQRLVDDETRWKAMLLPTYNMLEVRADKDLLRCFRTQARNYGANLQDLPECKEAFEHLSTLKAIYLMIGEGGRYADGAVKYLGQTLKEEGTGELFEALIDTTMSYFDEGFERWARAVAGGQFVADSSAPEGPSLEGYVTPAVALIPGVASDWIALALGIARTGDYESALLMLNKAVASLGDDEERARVTRESERIQTLIATRDAFLQDLVGNSRKKLRISVEEGNIVAQVTAVEAGVLKLSKNRTGVEEVKVREIPPSELVDAMGRDASDFGPGWVASYALLIGGESRWERGLDEKEAGASELVADAKADIVSALDLSVVAGMLDGIARLPLPTSLDSARAVIDASKALLERFANEKIVRERTDALTELCQKAFGVMHDAEGLSSQLAGKVETLDQGRVRMSYAFDSAEDLKDWSKDFGYLAERRQKKFPVQKTEQESVWKIQAGNLEGEGAVCLRHALQWEPPLTVSYELLYGRPQPGQGILAHIVMGLCDDGQGSWTGGLDIYDLETHEKALGKVLVDVENSDRAVKAATAYKMKLVHDGNSLTMYRNGEKLRTISVEERKAGGIFLWMHSTVTVAVKSIEIEGKIQRTEEDPGKARWVKQQLADMGLYL